MEAAPCPKRLVRSRQNGDPSGPQYVMGTVVGAGDAMMNPSVFLSSSSSQSSCEKCVYRDVCREWEETGSSRTQNTRHCTSPPHMKSTFEHGRGANEGMELEE